MNEYGRLTRRDAIGFARSRVIMLRRDANMDDVRAFVATIDDRELFEYATFVRSSIDLCERFDAYMASRVRSIGSSIREYVFVAIFATTLYASSIAIAFAIV